MRAVVVAGGDAVPEDAALLSGADLVIAADGGARWLDGVGRRPDLLIGDMDSVDPDLLARLAGQGAIIERHPAAKDASDVELAVERAIASGADEIVVLGALGGKRLDHELANLLMLADPLANGVGDLWLVRGGTRVRVVGAGRPVQLAGRPGDVVTLLPIGGDAEGVRTEGLRFHLDGERLNLGRSRGLSNVVVAQPASVSLERGLLLVVETETEGAGR